MRRVAPLVVAVAGVAACAADDGGRVGVARLALDAFCEAEVAGSGVVDVETDYLAHVVACENGAASFEALKAQAVTARSYLYYSLERNGSIGDGQGSQVYSCGRAPTDVHYDAVAATAGEVLRFREVQIAAFYVAGAHPDAPECVGGVNDTYGTEQWVTYNDGRSGDDVEQTPLGWVSPTNYANRGCMSQNGSHCLAEAGRGYQDIVRFYYGADIELVRAEGPCVAAPPTEPDPMEPEPPSTGSGEPEGGEGGEGGGEPEHELEAGGLQGGCAVGGGRTGGAGALVLMVLALLGMARGRRAA